MASNVKLETDNFLGSLSAAGAWLDQNLPNPPLPQPQSWTIKYNSDEDYFYVHFADENYALLFALRGGT